MSAPKLYTSFAKYYDRLESQYRDYEEDARWILETLQARHASSVIDVSCGTGNHITRLAPMLNLSAMDASREMIEIASKKNSSIQFLVSDFLNFPFRKERFSGAICMYWSLAGLDEKLSLSLFQGVNSILSLDGTFIFDVENSEGIKENLLDAPFIDSFFAENDGAVIRANLSKKIDTDLVDWHAYYLIETGGVSELFEDRMNLRFYSRKQLERLLDASGFKVEQVLSGPFKPYEVHSPSLYFVARKV
ncbi:MAG: class I SAM-dependent DNA methyltransferase [Nitrososphaerales archaeon]